MTANPYGPQTREDEQANEAVVASALALLAEMRGRPLTRAQRDMQTRADRLARWLQRETTRR
jgi:cobalamin biosynthesis protein CobT